MSIQSRPYYWVTCDWAECGASAQDSSEFSAWPIASWAVTDAGYAGWLAVRAADGSELHYCNKHGHWNEDEDELLPGPAEVSVEKELK